MTYAVSETSASRTGSFCSPMTGGGSAAGRRLRRPGLALARPTPTLTRAIQSGIRE